MHDNTQKFTPQPYTVFGGIYVQEQHSDMANRNRASRDIRKLIDSVKLSLFFELMKSLRATLHPTARNENDSSC